MGQRWTPTPGFKEGDRITMLCRPPRTLWDRLLWRLLRVERKRELVEQTFVVQSVRGPDGR